MWGGQAREGKRAGVLTHPTQMSAPSLISCSRLGALLPRMTDQSPAVGVCLFAPFILAAAVASRRRRADELR